MTSFHSPAIRATIILFGVATLSACALMPALPVKQSFSTADVPAVPSASPEPIADLGPRPMANGAATRDPSGAWLYTVVEGDVAGVICDRFGREWWQLETLDRQDGFDCYSTIHPGQTLVTTTASWDEIEDGGGLPSTWPLP